MVGAMIIDTLPDSIWLPYKFTFLVNFFQDDTIVGFPIAFAMYGSNPEYLFKLLRFNSEFLRVQF